MSNPSRNGFQGFVNQQPPPAEQGDFAGSNIRTSLSAGPQGYISDGTVTVGWFAFATPNNGDQSANPPPESIATGTHTSGQLVGFVHRENQGIIVPFLAYFVELIQAGFPVTLMSRGDYWTQFAGAVTRGQPVYADATTGQPTVTSGGNILTPFVVVDTVPADASFTGVLAYAHAGDEFLTLTVSSLTGVVEIGAFLNGVSVGNNVYVLQQLTGTPGAAGTYLVSGGAAVGSEAMTTTSGKLARISSWQTT